MPDQGQTTKTNPGNYFEDFIIGNVLHHATPRTLSAGDAALYQALYGSRFAAQSSAEFARSLGLKEAPIDDILAFHIVFGKTVPDVSLNAVANLGYADCRFEAKLYPGDTVSATSEVIGLKENSNGRTGVVYVRSRGVNQRDETVIEYVRWVMVNKRDPETAAPNVPEGGSVPELPDCVSPEHISISSNLSARDYSPALAGSENLWDDYEPGEKIDHVDGFTLEEAEHMTATRLYQNTAKVHFNEFTEKDGRFGRRIIYGGHIISFARSLSFNGLANAQFVAAINAGSHTAPAFAGDTVFAWSEILDKDGLTGNRDWGALRVRTVATKDRLTADFPYKTDDGSYDPSVILDLDYWVLMPRR